MANQEQLDLLKQGVEVWNQWREKHIDIRLDLIEADLRGANLSRANLSRANLNKANLSKSILYLVDLAEANLSEVTLAEANLSKANLSRANLNDANLSFAYLEAADLSKATLSRAILDRTILDRANLNEATLSRAILSRANLNEATLSGAILSGASILGIILGAIDLREVKGLETVQHLGPSSIGVDTIYRSHGDIPEAFLKGAGVDDTFITYIRSLVGKAIEYYTCFISYSSKDEAFARRLHTDLQSYNVRCWFAPEDLKIGEKFWHRIDESIKLYDKLLVVLSQHSVESEWVEREVMAALEKERQEKRLVLFPITLDEAFKQTTAPWAADIRRSRHTGNFIRWKRHDDYQKGLERLLRDLQASTQ